MITINNIRARLIDLDDLDFLNKIRLSEFVQNNVGHHLFTNNILQREWIEKISKSNDSKYLILEIFENDNIKKIGLIRFTNIDLINRSMCVGGDIIQEYSGKGFGKVMYKIIFKIGFDIWGLNRLWLSVLENNSRAINLYNKVGFKNEGKFRQAIYKNGNFENYLIMSILKSENK